MSLVVLLQFSGLMLASFVSAVTALWVLSRFHKRQAHLQVSGTDALENSVAFLFDDEILVNGTVAAKDLIGTKVGNISDWDRLLRVLEPRFPDLGEEFSKLAERGSVEIRSLDGDSELLAGWRDGLAKISLVASPNIDASVELEGLRNSAMKKELETLRATAQSAPFLVWRQRIDGTIVWANNAYLTLSQLPDPESQVPVWPPKKVFDVDVTVKVAETGVSNRITAHISGEVEPRWFDCYETSIGVDRLFTAVAADKVVKAEIALRDFVQTLTKTFAYLTIGLAIFDKQRRLALFNPALTDLTSLPIEFLSSRPTLVKVLDRLHEKQMIPEPKDYKSWRNRLHELEAAAVSGTYEETWALANGQTFRVTGRPHPDGAVAFLFEDISAEISLTRHFRAELETSQAVLDSLDEAIAVFSPLGTLTFSNAAYGKLWGIDSSKVLGNFSVIDATSDWSGNCAPSPVWGDFREFVSTIGERAEWDADVRTLDGRKLLCRFKPISGGATLVGFSLDDFPETLRETKEFRPLVLATSENAP